MSRPTKLQSKSAVMQAYSNMSNPLVEFPEVFEMDYHRNMVKNLKESLDRIMNEEPPEDLEEDALESWNEVKNNLINQFEEKIKNLEDPRKVGTIKGLPDKKLLDAEKIKYYLQCKAQPRKRRSKRVIDTPWEFVLPTFNYEVKSKTQEKKSKARFEQEL